MSEAAHSLEAGSSLSAQKKESASVTRRLFFYGRGNCSRLQGNYSLEIRFIRNNRVISAPAFLTAFYPVNVSTGSRFIHA
ncbi:MAG: hypothetical protein FWF77_07700 [Defluviitaleaceae bacterium]|nr:hypothetical protein [Defluviitaleaceae bacterium]